MNCVKSQNQCVNTLIFPGGMAPASYDTSTFKNNKYTKLIYIPFKSKVCSNFSYISAAPTYIPAILAINKFNKAGLFCIHFHGNACDIAQIAICADRESTAFNAHYMIIEYPRFGIADGHPNEVVLNEVSRIVHDFVIHELRVNYKNVVLIGRSIGTGPACSLASYLETIGMPVAALILQSPYTSLADVTSDLLGCVAFFMLDRFPNWKYLIGNDNSVIKSPVLFIHADQDKIIDCNHSKIMHECRAKCGLPCELFIQVSTEQYTKGHNYFEYEKDMVEPSKQFLLKHVPKEVTANLLLLPQEVIEQTSIAPVEFVRREDMLIAAQIEASNKASLKASRRESTKTVLSGRSSLTSDSADSMKGPVANSVANSVRTNNSVRIPMQQEKPPSKWTRDIMCFWALCPCSFCSECCCAMCCNTCTITYRFVSGSQPVFNYRALKPADAFRGSVWQLIFRGKDFKKSVNEEEAQQQVAQSRKEAVASSVILKRPSKNGAHRKISESEITNPILSRRPSGVIIVEEPNEKHKLPVGTVVRSSDGAILTKNIDEFTFTPSSSFGSEDGSNICRGLDEEEVKLDYVPG